MRGKLVLRWILERKVLIDLLIEFTDTRLGIEPRAAALGAETATDRQRAQIIAAIDRMIAADKGDDDALSSKHRVPRRRAQRQQQRFLRQFTDLAETTLRFSIRRTNEYKGVLRASAKDHKRVADAIMAGDATGASREMYKLIEGALNLLLSHGNTPKRRVAGRADRAAQKRKRGSDT